MTTKEYIITLLEGYVEKKRKIELLKYELNNPPNISDNELIESLSLGSQLSSAINMKHGQISDKTMMIAMTYREAWDTLVGENTSYIARELRTLESELAKLEHHLSLLDDKFAKVLQLYYFEGKTLAEISSEFDVSRYSIANYRDRGVDELVAMYEVTAGSF